MSLLSLSSLATCARDLGFSWGHVWCTHRRHTPAGPYCVAALLQCNLRPQAGLRIAGAPVRQEQALRTVAPATEPVGETRSILIVMDTDAPLLPNQPERRASLGLARLGATSDNGSVFTLPNGSIGPVFEATVEDSEENIVNALLTAERVAGVGSLEVTALPTNRPRESHPR